MSTSSLVSDWSQYTYTILKMCSMIPKAQATKEKTDTVGFIKIKKCCASTLPRK